MRFTVAMLLCGCNQIFDLEATSPIPLLDAAYFDAPVDAPFSCPPIGETPRFSGVLHQVIQNCNEYSASSTGRATALCTEPSQLAEGPLDGVLSPIAGLEQTTALHVDLSRYAPEGDELFVRTWEQSTVIGRIRSYRRDGDGFTYAYDVVLPDQTIDSFVRFGSPSRGPRRRMMVTNKTSVFQEIEFDTTGAAILIGTYTAADLGAAALSGIPPNLTPDGLRLVVFGADESRSGVMYADRPSLADRFRPLTVLDSIPTNPTPFMTETCSRVYLSNLGYSFWVQRE